MEIMKTCKECGKLFHPRNSRQRYCDDKHYRPCPTCGKPVEIKYLTDPTPRCADCRKNGVKLGTKSPFVDNVSEESPENDYQIKTYKGKDSCGFIKEHKYLVKVVPNNPYGHVVEAIKDLTADDDVEIGLPIVNMNSYNYFFK